MNLIDTHWRAVRASCPLTGYTAELFGPRSDATDLKWTVGFSVHSLVRQEDLGRLVGEAQQKGYEDVEILRVLLDSSKSETMMRQVLREKVIREKGLSPQDLAALAV